MPETNTYEELAKFIDKNKDQYATANQLWKKYGQDIPFRSWLDNQIIKAKSSSWFKEGMSISEIVEGNKSNSKSSEVNKNKDFKIAGMNGYAVIGGIVIVSIIGYVIYKRVNK